VKYQPTEDRVVIRQPRKRDVSEGGIHLPEASRDRDDLGEGEIVAVGPGKLEFHGGGWVHKPMPVAVGNVVRFNKYRGEGGHFEDGDDEYRVMLVDDVLAVQTAE